MKTFETIAFWELRALQDVTRHLVPAFPGRETSAKFEYAGARLFVLKAGQRERLRALLRMQPILFAT